MKWNFIKKNHYDIVLEIKSSNFINKIWKNDIKSFKIWMILKVKYLEFYEKIQF